ncbi:MAG: ATP-dependent 6-phosphofructokinase [Labilithrix sp.]|nr:ATP-dependent 6-phosphofructokinase [Labilithrix sp.]
MKPCASPEWTVKTLGERLVPSPLGLSNEPGDGVPDYVPDGTRVLFDVELAPGETCDPSRAFEKAGPRDLIYFDPPSVHAGVVTAGGLCPGSNNVIRSLVLHLYHRYGVREITGFRYGFAGLDPAANLAPLRLGPNEVEHIHTRGGSVLGTSRGRHDVGEMLDTLAAYGVDCLFTIGGDGTMRAAHALAEGAAARKLKLAVIGVPKTVDNDIAFVDKTFGFETAVEMSRLAIDAANIEATSVRNGVGLVKLMGRNAGFIAAHATLASHDVNVCLVPEVRFSIDGPSGLLAYLERRIATRAHAVVVVAEGCGKLLVERRAEAGKEAPRDASGNLRYASAELDIGVFLKDRITEHFASAGVEVNLKYIDPSYMIRGVPADANDAVFCDELARVASHAAMAGKTDMLVGRWHRKFTHVPLAMALSERRCIDPDRELWLGVTETTGQPRLT